MAFAEVTVVVDGAVEETATFYDYAILTEFVNEVEDDARGHGYRTEIYVQYHDHEDEGECECAQFEQDHSPYLVVNP